MARSCIPPVGTDLKAGRVTAGGTPVGAEFQSRIVSGKKECRPVHVSSGTGDLELVYIWSPRAKVSGLEHACSSVYMDKSIHDFVHLIYSCRPGLTFSRTAGFLAGAEPPGLRYLK